jgi:arylsulfatase A-like enzyme
VAIKEHALRERTADAVLARAAPWLEKNRDDQLFAFLHFYDVHGPYDAPTNSELGPPPTNGTPLTLPGYWPESDKHITDPVWLEKAYDKEIELVDVELGRVMDALGPRLDNTVFIVTADHGESLTEHGYLFDHGDDLYDASLRVPLLIRYPKGVKAGQRIDCQVGGVDVAATVLDLVGVDDHLPRDGRSRKAWLEGQPCDENAPVVSSTTYGRFVAVPPVAHSLRKPDEKVIVYDDKPVELFDLTADAGETQNLAPSGRSRDAEGAFRALLSTGGAVQGASMDAATCEALKGLGYIEGDAPCGPIGATP